MPGPARKERFCDAYEVMKAKLSADTPRCRGDLSGIRYGRLLALHPEAKKSGRRPKWLCLCDCGVKREVCADQLRKGKTKSCGCLKVDHGKRIGKASRVHATSSFGNKEYSALRNAIFRCHNGKSKSFPYYGSRGIKVCDRWVNGEDGLTGFDCFLNDMGNAPKDKPTLDRIDNEGDYTPDNCRWADYLTQASNRRPYGSALS